MSTIGLESRLLEFRRRGMSLGLAAWVGWGIALIIGAVLVGMWTDLVVELPAAVRAGWGIAAIIAGLVLILRGTLSARKGVQTSALARRLDEVAGSRGQILSGVDLSMNSGMGGQTLSRGMVEIAIERAGELISKIKPGEAISGKPVRKPYLVLGAMLVVIGIIGVFARPLAATQLSRFLDPFGDHPPYSRLKFTVEPGDTRVIYGSGFDVRAKTEGEIVERVDLVMQSGDSAQEVLPMFPEGNGAWRATITNVTAAGKYRVKAGSARSRFYNLEVVTVPKLEGVRVRITPPSYANKAVYEGAVPESGIAGLLATRVEVFAKSNRPLSRGQIDLLAEGETTRQAIPMQPVNSGASEVVGTFNIEKNGRMELRVFDVAGQSSTESFSAQITLLPDERPFIRLIQPFATSYATPTTPIPVEVIAEDDNGVARVQIFRSLNDSRPMPMDIDAPKPNPTQFQVRKELPLAQYGLKPGDVIKVFARVEDNDPAGTKGAESSVAVVQIISEEDYRKMILSREGLEVLQSKYEAARRRMEAVNEAIDKLMEELKKSPDGELSEEQKKAIEKLAEEMNDHAQEIENAAKEPLPFDLDKNLTKQLEKLAEQMKKEAGEAAKAGKSQGMGVKGALDKLKEMQQRLGGDKKEFEEKATEPIEHLAKIYPLLEDQAKYIQLYERQRDLEQRVASLKDKDRVDDPKIKARMRDLENEQANLKEDLQNLLEDIGRHTAELPDDPRLADLKQTAEDFVNNVQNSEAADEMASAELGLSQFSGSQGHQFSKAAADTLEKFLSKCQGMEGQGMACLKFSPGLAAGLGDTVAQLLGAAGLNTGPGSSGRGGGYSAQRSTLNNVGIYGRLPTRSKMTRGGGGKSERGGGSAVAGNAETGRNAALELSGKNRTVGEADVVVPVKYKRRVGEYFQRVADELGEK